MNILFQCRPIETTAPGGDLTQITRTKAALEALGHTVQVDSAPEPDLSAFHVVHVFGVQPVCMPRSFRQIANAKKQGKPVALSTIYWSYELTTASIQAIEGAPGEGSIKERVWYAMKKTARRGGLEIMRKSVYENAFQVLETGESPMGLQPTLAKPQQDAALLLADILLPNTQAEMDLLREKFALRNPRVAVIPNAADLSYANASPRWFQEKYGITDFVMCSARVEHRKNQLRLIRALKGTGIKLVLAGNLDGSTYVQMCQKEADENVIFTGNLAPEELASAYAAAKVHVLPSFFDTPGISSLEAGFAGCNLVSTPIGGPTEYFDSYALYCDPNSVDSIRAMTVVAHQVPKNPLTREYLLSRFTWQKVAEKTVAAYESILK